MELIPHPGQRPTGVAAIEASVWREGAGWRFRYLVEGAQALVLADPETPGRADELWQTTCFEAFVGVANGGYVELNFAPSGQWATYRFDAYREGMRAEEAAVEVWLEGGETWIAVEAVVRCAALAAGAPLGLTAVIEEPSAKSFWALDHAAGAPDFHQRSCFIARLPE
jgi:hypothetical protein